MVGKRVFMGVGVAVGWMVGKRTFVGADMAVGWMVGKRTADAELTVGS